VDDGIEQLAGLMLSLPAVDDAPDLDLPGPGWRVAVLRSILLLDQPVREAIELCRVVAERDGLGQIDPACSLPRAPGRVVG
jgi:hypothetical protein